MIGTASKKFYKIISFFFLILCLIVLSPQSSTAQFPFFGAPYSGFGTPWGGFPAFNTGLGAPYTGAPGPYTGFGAPYSGVPGPYTGSFGAPFTGIQGPYSGFGTPFTGIQGPYTGFGTPFTGVPGPYTGFGTPFTGMQGPYTGAFGNFGMPFGQFGMPFGQFGMPFGQFGTPFGQFGMPFGQFGMPYDPYGGSNDPGPTSSGKPRINGTWKGEYTLWEFDEEWDSVLTGNITMVLSQKSGDSQVTGYIIVKDFWDFLEAWDDNEGYFGGLDDSTKGYISNGSITYNDDNTIKKISLPAKFHPDLNDPEDTTDEECYWWIFFPVQENSNTLYAEYTTQPNSYIYTPIIIDETGPTLLSFNISMKLVK